MASERRAKRTSARAIAFELSWRANALGCRKDSIEASFVTGHDFSRAAKRSPKQVGLQPLPHFELLTVSFSTFSMPCERNPNVSSFKCDCPGTSAELKAGALWARLFFGNYPTNFRIATQRHLHRITIRWRTLVHRGACVTCVTGPYHRAKENNFPEKCPICGACKFHRT
jgi:hypothetical protein